MRSAPVAVHRGDIGWSTLYSKQETNIFKDPMRLLYFAPEACFIDVFSRQSNIEYFPVDIDESNPFMKEQVDMQNMRYSDNSFDVVYCGNVLERVPDDRKAMRELYRVLKTGGWAILQVPINGGSETTIEDLGINTPE
jgi:SAM-dependent methyltransferase